jgi:hypothetical protein
MLARNSAVYVLAKICMDFRQDLARVDFTIDGRDDLRSVVVIETAAVGIRARVFRKVRPVRDVKQLPEGPVFVIAEREPSERRRKRENVLTGCRKLFRERDRPRCIAMKLDAVCVV